MGFRRVPWAIGVAFLLLSACSSGGGSPSSPSPARPSAPPSNESSVAGGYVRAEQQLVLSSEGFHATIATNFTADGTYTMEGSTLVFSGGGDCSGEGRYAWKQDHRRLTLTEVAETCALRRSALTGTWTLIRSLADAVPGHFALLSDGASIAMYRGEREAPENGPLVMELRTTEAAASFEPTIIRGAPGQLVHLSLVNVDPNERHTFTIAEQHIDVEIPANDRTPVPVTVTIPQSGNLLFVCKYHVAVYMLGELQAE